MFLRVGGYVLAAAVLTAAAALGHGTDAQTSAPAAAPAATPAEQAALGLWAYQSLGREGGTFTKLSGWFLFRDGWFVQQSLNDGEPFDKQLAQAHAGPYRVDGRQDSPRRPCRPRRESEPGTGSPGPVRRPARRHTGAIR